MGKRTRDGAGTRRARSTRAGVGAASTIAGGLASGELHDLSAEVISLLHEQAFSTGEDRSEADICETFSRVLLKHWELCCVTTFLRDAEGHLSESAAYVHRHLDRELARRIAETLAGRVESDGGEYHLWLDETGANGDAQARELAGVFEEAGLRAGVAVPIRASGALAGALVVCSADPERLRAALRGIRFVGPPIIIAVGHARRAAALLEQRRQIEALVTTLRERTNALEEANRELQRVGRYRSLFLGRMSHELRTPLTSILGFAEILLDREDLTETQRRFCEKIQTSGHKLQASLNQLVDLSRLEAGQTELFLHEFSLRETLRESCAAVARLAQKQDVTLDCRTPSEAGSLVSDEGKLRQVLYNFLAHAIGRSPAGGRVHIRVGATSRARLHIDICDDGEALRDPAHLFDAVQVDAPNERGTNMNELGLVIAHRLVGALGGKVTLTERKPRGLAVRLTLPTCPTEHEKAAASGGKTVTSDK
ncbi:MAG TPA: HAMP domain-containing sensor histidine kinase [Pyrinomonadaceae bacterium]|nr:HAMP domain-containing sensor histidine kinase [Pyrinomonadaceae bacterium]